MRVAAFTTGLAAVVFAACTADSGGGDSGSATDMANQSIVADKQARGDAFGVGSGAGGVRGRTRAAGSRTEEALAVQAPAAASPPPPPGAEPPQPGTQLPTTQSAVPSMVIRTGDARVEVDSLEIRSEERRV